MKFIKENLLTVIIIVSTVLLAGIAIFTAVRLYQLRNQPVAPSAPESEPQAHGDQPVNTACQDLTFSITTQEYDCDLPCTENFECQLVDQDYVCYDTGTAKGKVCRLATNPTSTTCSFGTSTPTPTPTPTATPTSTPTGSPTATPTATATPTSTATPSTTSTPTPTSTSTPNGSTSTPTPVAGTSTPTPDSGLPQAGAALPTIIGISAGMLLLIGALILAL